MPSKPKLSQDTILEAEFGYIAATATQAYEDRARVATFYFVSVGSLIAAIISAQLFQPESAGDTLQNIYLAFCALFSFLTVLGYLTLAQLARLRTAWMDSVKAMNRIKTYYIETIGTETAVLQILGGVNHFVMPQALIIGVFRSHDNGSV